MTLTLIGWPASLMRQWGRVLSKVRDPWAASAHERPDAAALSDLGVDPSEWSSVQAEAAGLAALTRRNIVQHTLRRGV